MKNQTLEFVQNKQMARWAGLSAEEKMMEFLELIRSPYWHLLPEEIRSRINKMFPNAPQSMFSSTFVPHPHQQLSYDSDSAHHLFW